MQKKNKKGFTICDNKGFHIAFQNGWVVSVQFGRGNYSENYDLIFSDPKAKDYPSKEGMESDDAEVWCWNEITEEYYPEEPLSNQTPKQVLNLLNKFSKKIKPTKEVT